MNKDQPRPLLTASAVRKKLREQGDAKIAEHSQRFFKTGKGEYGEGDQFLGIRVPVIRKLVNQYQALASRHTISLLRSRFHEERLFAVLVLVEQFRRGSDAEKSSIYSTYIDNTKHINNWDLIDVSAHHIVGAYLEDKDKRPIYALAKSKNLLERRIAIMSTFHMIKNHNFKDALRIADILKNDAEDLIHKAVGWMLREIGNRNLAEEERFLKTRYTQMPRTMLRYAIEKFPERKRKTYLRGTA